MGLWDAVRGRRREVKPDLDALFAVPSAAVTLQASAGFAPTGVGAVCFRSGGGAAWAQVETEIRQLLGDDPEIPDDVEVLTDSFGYTWLVVRRDITADPDLSGLCTDLHAVNTTLAAQGFESGLLCTLVPFADPTGQRFGLVYLYKQGSFYPFAPEPGTGQRRDNLLEIRVRDLLAGDLVMEADLGRWLALWGAPGL